MGKEEVSECNPLRCTMYSVESGLQIWVFLLIIPEQNAVANLFSAPNTTFACQSEIKAVHCQPCHRRESNP